MTDVAIRRAKTAALTMPEIARIREILAAAFEGDEHGGFTEDDWQHALGGVHFLVEARGAIVGHAAVVERELHVGVDPAIAIRSGYVEAVAIDPARQRSGLGSELMRDVAAHLAERYELGALGTGRQPFYERLGWQIWRGPTGVRVAGAGGAGGVRGAVEATPDEDGYILILRTPSSPALDLTDRITCEWRPGDAW